MKRLLILFAIVLGAGQLIAQDVISNISLRITPSFEHISVHVDFDGDENRNSVLEVTFQKVGASVVREAAPSMRAANDMIVDGSPLNRNFHATSVMFLETNSDYEININITDQDGGSFEETITASTKQIAFPSAINFIRHVEPGDGGGDGGVFTPYLGLQAAADNANPGDVFLVADGTYAPFELLESGTEVEPIVFLAGNLHAVTIDGENTDRGIITLGSFNDSIRHVIIDGFKIENGNWGIDAQNTQFVTVRNNKFSNIGYGYYNRRENGWEHDQHLTNNEFIGITPWPSSGIPGERAIDFRGNNNTASYNYIENFGDGVSTDGPPYGSSYGLDIHNNDFYRIVDDFVEVDGIVSNARVYANRGFNGRMGASLAPVLGGPAYIFRNVFYNMELSTLKMNRGPSGLIMAHNTGLKDGNATSSNAGWQNTILLNNILGGTRYAFEEYGLVVGSVDDWDYNAYYSTREIGTDPWFKWNDIRYDNITELFMGANIEQFGIEIDLSTFVNASMPDVFTTEYNIDDVDLNLAPNSPCINTGTLIPNINDPFVTDGMPDRGAIEFGADEIKYGPDFDFVNSNTYVNTNLVELSISPNPAEDFISVDMESKYYMLQIMDINGNLLLESNEDQFIISKLSEGIYFIRALDELNNILAQQKFIKARR